MYVCMTHSRGLQLLTQQTLIYVYVCICACICTPTFIIMEGQKTAFNGFQYQFTTGKPLNYYQSGSTCDALFRPQVLQAECSCVLCVCMHECCITLFWPTRDNKGQIMYNVLFCVCVYIYIYIYIYTHTHIYIYTHTHTYIYIYI